MTKLQEKPRIFIVEDEILIASDLESRLTGFGYSVCGQATSARQALIMIERDQPELVLMDVVLKGEMDGIDAARIIREKWGIPVVFVTAYADNERLERAKLTFPFGYRLKPIQERDLKITLEMALFVAEMDAKRRQTESELLKREETHRALVEGLPDIVMRFDREGRHLFVSRNVEEVVDLTADRFIGRTHRELGFSANICRLWEESIQRVFSSGEPFETEFSLEGKKGRTLFEWRLVPEFDPRDRVATVLSVSRDVTVQRRSEEKLSDPVSGNAQRFRFARDHSG